MITAYHRDADWYNAHYREVLADRPHMLKDIQDRWEAAVRYVVGSVLDLGFGLAEVYNMVEEREYLGIDHSRCAIDFARSKNVNPNARFQEADLENPPELEPHDTVILSEILEHVLDPEALARLALALARKRIVITVPVDLDSFDHVWPEWTRTDLENLFPDLILCEIVSPSELARDDYWLAVQDVGVARLREKIGALAPLPDLMAEPIWVLRERELRQSITSQDPRSFLKWEPLSKTMYSVNYPYTPIQLELLRSQPDFDSLWRDAIKESPVGNPGQNCFWPESSGQMIRLAYHWIKFREGTGLLPRDFDFIFEFGGGYGAMARLCRRLGFRGEYVSYDLPSLTALQEFYLAEAGVSDVRCISENLAEAVRNFGSNSLFIATWSLSESPFALRDEILPLISGFRGFLLTYATEWRSLDNMAYFRGFRGRVAGMRWSDFPSPVWSDSGRYLIGARK